MLKLQNSICVNKIKKFNDPLNVSIYFVPNLILSITYTKFNIQYNIIFGNKFWTLC